MELASAILGAGPIGNPIFELGVGLNRLGSGLSERRRNVPAMEPDLA